jgi:hypothetical protein
MKEGFSIVTEVVLPSDYQSLIDVEKIVGSVCDELVYRKMHLEMY